MARRGNTNSEASTDEDSTMEDSESVEVDNQHRSVSLALEYKSNFNKDKKK
jgi:hypothetical protein